MNGLDAFESLFHLSSSGDRLNRAFLNRILDTEALWPPPLKSLARRPTQHDAKVKETSSFLIMINVVIGYVIHYALSAFFDDFQGEVGQIYNSR